MQDHLSQHQSESTGIPTKPNNSPDVNNKAAARFEGGSRRRSQKTKSRRIMIRVTDEVFTALLAISRDQGCGLSDVVRTALNGSLKPETALNTPRKPALRPEEIDLLVDHYSGVVHEDIRRVRRPLFGQLLAASYVTKVNFPRTPGVLEGYEALLELQHLFGFGEHV